MPHSGLMDRDKIVKLIQAWKAAEKARRDATAEYVTVETHDPAQPMQYPPKVLDDADIARLQQLDREVDEARAAVHAAYRET